MSMGRLLTLLLASVACYAQIVITPSTPPVVNVGTTQQFTASGGTVTWSLAAGSAGSINASTGLYTAPTTITPKNTRGGCMLLPNDHVFNTRIDSVPVHASSDTWMATVGDVGAQIQPSFGLTTITNATPSVSMVFLYTPSNNGSFQIANAPDLWVENGYYTSPLAEVDRHITEINRETCTLTDIYNYYPAGTQGEGCPTCTAQSGVTYAANSYDLPATGGTDAASMYLQPLILTVSEPTAIPVAGDSITDVGAGRPVIVANTAIHSTNLTGWSSTSIVKNDIVGINLHAAGGGSTYVNFVTECLE